MSVEPLIAWVAAREALRKNKEENPLSFGTPNWTDDPILREYRFCNVRRRDDRVSRWLRQHVLIGANLTVSFSAFIEFTAFCRWNNWPPVIAEIMKRGLYPVREIDWCAVASMINQYRTKHKKAWTGAYMINAKGCEKGKSKANFIAEQVIGKSVREAVPQIEKALLTNSRREVWLVYNSIMNHGSFMSGQIVDDLGYTVLLSGAKDTNTWAPQGPGSLRGFNRLLGIPIKTRHNEGEWCTQLQIWRREIITALGKEYRDITLMDCQNCLCEFFKYSKTQLGEGRPRSKYRPETAF